MTRDNLDAAIEILESVRAHLHDADIGAACAAQRLADTPAFDHTRVLLQALGAASARLSRSSWNLRWRSPT